MIALNRPIIIIINNNFTTINGIDLGHHQQEQAQQQHSKSYSINNKNDSNIIIIRMKTSDNLEIYASITLPFAAIIKNKKQL